MITTLSRNNATLDTYPCHSVVIGKKVLFDLLLQGKLYLRSLTRKQSPHLAAITDAGSRSHKSRLEKTKFDPNTITLITSG